MRRLLLFLIFLLCASAQAEIIDGPANLRETPAGKVLASINDGIAVTPLSFKEGWYKIEIVVGVPKSALQEAQDVTWLEAGTPLTSFGLSDLGVTKARVRLENAYWEENGLIYGELVAFTHKANLKPESFVEARLEFLIGQGKTLITEGWGELMKEQGYDAWQFAGRFSSHMYLDPRLWEMGIEPRLIVFFCDDKLFSVYSTKSLKEELFRYSDRARDGRIYYMPGFPGKLIEEFENTTLRNLNTAG